MTGTIVIVTLTAAAKLARRVRRRARPPHLSSAGMDSATEELRRDLLQAELKIAQLQTYKMMKAVEL